MLVKIELLILFAENGKFTAYFLDRENKIVLPYLFNNWPQTREVSNVSETIGNVGARPIFLEVESEGCDALLNILTEGVGVIKMSMPLNVGIIYAQHSDLPIFTRQEILEREGIKLTPQFIEEMLLR